MEVLFSAEVSWQDREEYAPYQPTYLNLIVFERGNGPEVICTARTNWQERIEELRIASVPQKYLHDLSSLVYAKEELKALIG